MIKKYSILTMDDDITKYYVVEEFSYNSMVYFLLTDGIKENGLFFASINESDKNRLNIIRDKKLFDEIKENYLGEIINAKRK